MLGDGFANRRKYIPVAFHKNVLFLRLRKPITQHRGTEVWNQTVGLNLTLLLQGDSLDRLSN
jgi:hypothetical protein